MEDSFGTYILNVAAMATNDRDAWLVFYPTRLLDSVSRFLHGEFSLC